MSSILDYEPTSAMARGIREASYYGLHMADFASLSTNTRFDGFGNGTGYTVANWISDGVFANLSEVQTRYPVCQSGTDHVDWVLAQSASDYLIYGNLGSSNRNKNSRKLLVPAGVFKMTRPWQLGYVKVGTPPANLNGNGYVSITIEGEGPHYDPSGNGMNGTTFDFSGYTNDVGIALNMNVQTILRGFTLRGGYSYLNGAFGSILNSASVWDIEQYRSGGFAAANWVGGNAVNCGIAIDPYSSSTPAATYPARVLPAYFGGGTTSALFSTAGGSDYLIEDVNVFNWVLGLGRPHGDSNGEFIRVNRGAISYCPISIGIGHSQCRNVSFRDLNLFGFHTAFSNKGGTQNNANMHGVYDNVHASYGYQMFNHENADWSGPIELQRMYGEGIYRIGNIASGHASIRNSYFSFYDTFGQGFSPKQHMTFSGGTLDLEMNAFSSRNGIFLGLENHASMSARGNVVIIRGNATLVADAVRAYYFMNGFFGPIGKRSRSIINHQVWVDAGTSPTTQFPDGNGHAWPGYTHAAQNTVSFSPGAADSNNTYDGAASLTGHHQTFDVPHLERYLVSIGTCASRSGYDVVFPRLTLGRLKADVGDVFYIGDGSNQENFFVCTGISGGNMTLRQQNDFHSTDTSDYATSGMTQITSGVGYSATYICTRVMHNPELIVGTVASGGATITNTKRALQSANSVNTTALTMAAGDLFIHQEIDRLNAGSTALDALNPVVSVNTGTQTITLTDNFNVTDAHYPVVFYVKVFNA